MHGSDPVNVTVCRTGGETLLKMLKTFLIDGVVAYEVWIDSLVAIAGTFEYGCTDAAVLISEERYRSKLTPALRQQRIEQLRCSGKPTLLLARAILAQREVADTIALLPGNINGSRRAAALKLIQHKTETGQPVAEHARVISDHAGQLDPCEDDVCVLVTQSIVFATHGESIAVIAELLKQARDNGTLFATQLAEYHVAHTCSSEAAVAARAAYAVSATCGLFSTCPLSLLSLSSLFFSSSILVCFFFERADLDRYRLVVHYCVQGQGEVKSKSLMTLYNEYNVVYTSSSEAAVAARAAYFVSARRFVVSIFLSFPCSLFLFSIPFFFNYTLLFFLFVC